MKINAKKTQILCISGSTESRDKAEINIDGVTIESDERLKIVGFWFGRRPDASAHVQRLT